jgi:hypothetical protein
MKKAELLAQLAVEVEEVTAVTFIEDQPGNIKYYIALVLEQDGFDVVKQSKIGFFVKNEGAGNVGDPILDVNGDPTYEQIPTLDVNGDPVLDVNGDPTFTEGAQIFVTEDQTEKAWKEKSVALPKDKNALGMTYLAGKVMAGEIYGFKMTEAKPDLGPFSFFVVEVMVVNKDGGGVPDGTATPQNWRVQMDGAGSPFHVVIV